MQPCALWHTGRTQPHSLLRKQDRLPGSCPAAQAKPAQVHSKLDALARVHAGLRSGKATLASEVSFTSKSVSKDVTLDPDACSVSPACTAAAVFWRSMRKPDPEAYEAEDPMQCQSVQMAHKRRNGTWRVTPSGRGEPRVESWTQVAQGWSKSGRWFGALYVEEQDWEEYCTKAQVRLQAGWRLCASRRLTRRELAGSKHVQALCEHHTAFA